MIGNNSKIRDSRSKSLGLFASSLAMVAIVVTMTGSTCDLSMLTTGGLNSNTNTNSNTSVTPGVLSVQVLTDSIAAAGFPVPAGSDVPDDIDVNLTPIAYTVAFKRIVLKGIDPITNTAISDVEIFNTDDPDDALIIDLANNDASSLLDVTTLPSGTYTKADIEVFYLDMTVPTLFPGTTSNDISYRMVFEDMGTLQARDFLLFLEPEWFEDNTQLGMTVTEAGWYWMDRGDPDNVVAVDGATEHPTFPVLDLFANEEFWSAEHKVLEGGVISPELEFNAEAGGILTMKFDVTEKFNFKDFHDDMTEADGLWEIRKDGGIHPFPPDIECVPDDAGSTANGTNNNSSGGGGSLSNSAN